MKKSLLFLITTLILISCTGPYKKVNKDELVVQLTQFPRTLNSMAGGDAYSSLISTHIQQALLSSDDEDYSILPAIAEKWKVGSDKKTYTYYLNKNARFSDGKPVTAYDVEFTYNLLYSPEKCTLCQGYRDFLGPIEEIKVLDKYTIRFKMKNVHFYNLEKLGGVSILPKHIYGAEGKDFNKDFNKEVYGSGPYILLPPKDKKRITLVKNTNWWMLSDENSKKNIEGYHNFNKITFRVIKDSTVAFELFKKRKLDTIYITTQLYSKWDDQSAEPWQNKMMQRIESKKNYPHNWGGIALNMRRGVTADKKFRKALQLLLNRDLLNEKIYKNKKVSICGPFVQTSPYSAKTKAIPFNPKKALSYLKDLGYTNVGKDGILFRIITKEGKNIKQRASMELMHAYEPHNKWATIFKEDAKKVGVEITIKFVEWTTATKLMDEFKFDGFVIGWSGGVVPAPSQLFSGKNANAKGTSNMPGLDNPRLNKLITLGPSIFNKQKRYKVYREIEKIIIDEQPYVFLSTQKNHMVGCWTDQVKPADPAFLQYTGNDTRNPYYSRWLPVK